MQKEEQRVNRGATALMIVFFVLGPIIALGGCVAAMNDNSGGSSSGNGPVYECDYTGTNCGWVQP